MLLWDNGLEIKEKKEYSPEKFITLNRINDIPLYRLWS